MELLEFIYAVLIGLPLYILLVIFAGAGTIYLICIMVFQVLSVAFAPLGGLVFAVKARRKKIGFLQCLLIGATFSSLLLLPWIYLLQHINSNRHPFQSITSTYRWLHLIWIGIIVSIPAPVLILGFLNVSDGTPSWILVLIPVMMTAIMWRISTKHVTRMRYAESERIREEPNKAQLELMPYHTYIMPFLYASIAIVSIPSAWVLVSTGFQLLHSQ